MADNSIVGPTSAFAGLRMFVAALAVAVLFGCASQAARAYSTGSPCSQAIEHSPSGVTFRVLFAKNGTVQRYEVIGGVKNTESINDARIDLEKAFGPAGIYAPPLKIVGYKPAPGGGGMMIPDKAIDSCGRTLSFGN